MSAKTRKKPGKGAVRTALSILKELSKGERRVHVMMTLGPVILSFESAVKKQTLGHNLTMPGLEITILPQVCDQILLSPDGGLALARNDIWVFLDAKELSADELQKLYPSVSTLVH